MKSGRYVFEWDATNDYGESIGAGLYIAHMVADGLVNHAR